MDYYSEDISKIYNEFKSSENGLNSNQINSKIQKFSYSKFRHSVIQNSLPS